MWEILQRYEQYASRLSLLWKVGKIHWTYDRSIEGTGHAEKIDTAIGEYIHPSALLCTDTATNYKKFAKIKGLHHETVNEHLKQRVKKGINHIQHVNNSHNCLKGWMQRFQGVATKYLENYLYWFRWLELGKNLAFEKRVEQMLILTCQNPII